MKPIPNTYLEKRSAMAVFFPTMDSSLAVTRSDWEAHCLLWNESVAMITVVALQPEEHRA